jgi:YspA, cpYpsA-related SLOG family
MPAAAGRFRLLVTGSRSWDDRDAIRAGLTAVLADHPDVVMVSGHCKDGADRLFEEALTGILGYRDAGEAAAAGRIEQHPADWDGPCRPSCRPGHRCTRRDGTSYCPAAGDYRNAEMAAAGAGLCLTAIDPCSKRDCRQRPRPHGSHGAVHCAVQAVAAGIPLQHLARTAPRRAGRA